jgi:hypothetical protein
MNAIEAIPIVDKLLGDLIAQAKDRETQLLVQQIQQHQLVIQRELMMTDARIMKMEADHAHAITVLREGYRSEAAKLHLQIDQLKAELTVKPKDELDDGCKQMLAALANITRPSGITREELIQWLRLPKAKGELQFDQLMNRRLVGHAAFGNANRGFPVHITPEGREYIVNNGLLGSNPGQLPSSQRQPAKPHGGPRII